MKTAKYRKRCFNQIEGVVAKNKALTAEVDRLRLEAKREAVEKVAQEERLLDLTRRLADKDRERKGKSDFRIVAVNYVVGFDDEQLLLYVWRRRSSVSERREISSTRSVLVRWKARARLVRS